MGNSLTASDDTLPGLACREVVELITNYLEGALPAEDRLTFERHLDECPHCSAYLVQMQATIAASGGIRAEELDPAKREELVALFRGWRNN